MGTAHVLHLLSESGLTVTADAGRLIVRPTERLTDETRQLIRENKTVILAMLTASDMTYWHWRVHFSDREPVEVYCNPDADFANIMQTYPDALAAEPIPERIKQVFTEAEWEALWLDTSGDWDEPTPEAVSTDDRRRCAQCRRLNPLGRCIAAERGEIAASQTYSPIRDILRRCEGYAPLKTTREQR